MDVYLVKFVDDGAHFFKEYKCTLKELKDKIKNIKWSVEKIYICKEII